MKKELLTTTQHHLLLNAQKYGKANPNVVLGKILAEHPELKKNIPETLKAITAEAKKINTLTKKQQHHLLTTLAPQGPPTKHKEEHDLFAFLHIPPGTEITTAFPPEPSKYPHIGHAKALLLNSELARKHHGTFILRFEDTNPKLAKQEYYHIHLDNYQWLGVTFDKIDYASDHMQQFYDYAENLITDGHAYLCSCPQERMKHNRYHNIECQCRFMNTQENIMLWKKMLNEHPKNLTLRLKADMHNKNTTMRDPTLMRIINHPHPRTKDKYKVWPTYDFENAVMDGIEKVTHRLRSKEFELRGELQRTIQRWLGLTETRCYEFARFNLQGVESSGRAIREKIENGELHGWDDPRLTTLVALRRRGFTPQAIKEFVLSTGITKAEATLTWDDLIAHNRRILDPKTYRYFFIHNPVKITITNAPKKKVTLPLHPDHKHLTEAKDPITKRTFGPRLLHTDDEFYITPEDTPTKNKTYRLMHLLNFKNNTYLSDDVNPKLNAKLIHWLPTHENLINITIIMPDATTTKGLGEPALRKLDIDDTIQFERFGFCRLDNKNNNHLTFRYAHR